jgi:hypothetical protein
MIIMRNEVKYYKYTRYTLTILRKKWFVTSENSLKILGVSNDINIVKFFLNYFRYRYQVQIS